MLLFILVLVLVWLVVRIDNCYYNWRLLLLLLVLSQQFLLIFVFILITAIAIVTRKVRLEVTVVMNAAKEPLPSWPTWFALSE